MTKQQAAKAVKVAREALQQKEVQQKNLQRHHEEALIRNTDATSKRAEAKKAYDGVLENFAIGKCEQSELDTARVVYSSAMTIANEAEELLKIIERKLEELKGPVYLELVRTLEAAELTWWTLIREELRATLRTSAKAITSQFLVSLRRTNLDNTADQLETIFFHQNNIFEMPSAAEWLQIEKNLEKKFGD